MYTLLQRAKPAGILRYCDSFLPGRLYPDLFVSSLMIKKGAEQLFFYNGANW